YMGFEEDTINVMKTPVKGNYSRILLLLAVELINNKIDYNKLERITKESGTDIKQRFGYLCEITAWAAKNTGFNKKAEELYQLSEKLYEKDFSWNFLNNVLPDFAKKIFISRATPEINIKWKIRDICSVSDVKEYIDLYLIYYSGKNV
ncbi:hypothetical protein KY314_04160, partial [Candidatus Woesearchaeota archaeon]|nr:hypothetical protein [Candidatus Woesearchaeota archaeon]